MRREVDRGAAAVEFALVAMLLVTLLLGIAEAGFALFVKGNVAGVAREGARYYALHAEDPAVQTATDGRVQAQAARVGLADGVTVTFPTVCTGAGEDFVTVRVAYRYPGLTGFFPFFNNIDLDGTGSMRCAG